MVTAAEATRQAALQDLLDQLTMVLQRHSRQWAGQVEDLESLQRLALESILRTL